MNIRERLYDLSKNRAEERKLKDERFYSLMKSVVLAAVSVFFAAYVLLALLAMR